MAASKLQAAVRAGLLAALAAVALWAAPQPATRISCAKCHRQEAQSQPQTSMGRAIELPPDQTILKSHHPKLAFAKNGYSYTIERRGNVSTYTVADGSNTLPLPIQYAFGTHMQTFVFAYRGRFYESMVSYYPSIDGLAITLGSESLRPRNLVEAIGREVPAAELVVCFGCHSTGAVIHDKLTLDSMQPGVSCEHCHTGAGAHEKALSQGKPGITPKKLGGMPAEEMSTFCGQCHRTWESIVRLGQFDENNVRFQPYRLANSKCFLGDDKRIRCTACHNPHAELVTESTSYDRACLACHDAKAGMKSCPTAESKCVSCHMPKVLRAEGHAVFTDHQIRIVHPGDPYPN